MAHSIVYNPLPVGFIRLLTIKSDDSEFLQGCLETVPLDGAPPYFALSYSWGTHKQEVPIYINGIELSISQSLYGVLQRLRTLGVDKPESNQNIRVERIWIDRICIDQDNISERSHQVEYMGHIYSRAIRTLIWLQYEPESCSAWQLVDKIYDVFRKEHCHAKYLTDIPFRMYSDAYHTSLRLPGWHDDSWESLRRLGQQLWFTRIWVIQEVVLSQQDPIILCGQVTYPWHRLGWVASWMRRNGYLRLPQVPNQLQNVDTIANIRRSSGCWRLDALLVATSVKFHASDQRDKVYALLGLAMECRTPKWIPSELTPNYELDVSQLYINVARYLFRKYRTLPALTRATGVEGDLSRDQREHSFEQLPSWVPNWCDFTVVERMVVKSFSWVPFSSPTEIQTLGFPKHYNASSGLYAKFPDSLDPSVLRIYGLNIGKIISIVQPTKQQSDEEYDHGPQMMSIWTTATRILSSTDIATWIESYIKATTAEQYYLGGSTAEQFLQHGSACLLRILSHFPIQSTDTISPSDFQDLVSMLRVRSIGGDPELYAALAGNFCFNRSFFITSNGYMGIGPSGAQVGDDIAVIFGGDVPYVLRRAENGFIFVGESYVQGLMNGEAVQGWRQGGLQEELIEIH